MSDERVVEEYRGFKLVAGLFDGVYKGTVWHPTGEKTRFGGASVNDVMVQQREFVDSFAKNKTAPEALEYVRAFQKIASELPDSYVAMLKAHYRAPNRTITATQLSEAGGYQNWGAANLHYGMLGKRLYEHIAIDLNKREDGTLVYTGMLATEGVLSDEESHWQWVMRPELAHAVEQLGLCD